MDNIPSEILEKLATKDFPVSTMHWVNVTHIVNPNNFYVRLRSLSSFLDELTDNILPTQQQKPDAISPGDIVVLKKDGEKHIRGKVIDTVDDENGTHYNIFAIDYGFVENKVNSDNIWSCEESVANIPPLAISCGLENSHPIRREWSKESIDAMKFFVGTEPAKMIIQGNDNDKLMVKLLNTNPDDIGTILAVTGYAKSGNPKPELDGMHNNIH